MITIGVLIMGSMDESIVKKKVHINITTENPKKTPKLKGRACLNPDCRAMDMDIRLLGPGVTAVTTA